jgi:hypothetical protein
MPRSIACAVVHGDPPEVFTAEDLDTLHWVLALKLIARTRGRDVPSGLRENLRSALTEERWGDAVELWMQVDPEAIDVYPSFDLHRPDDVALGPEELQFSPLFVD